jgi:signal peptidase I
MKGKFDWKTELIDLAKTMVFSLVVVFVITTFVATPVKVNGDSMYPQVKDEQVGFSMVFGKNQIERFDIVVVYIKETNKYLVKRVIALPNETVSYKDSQLYINGIAIEEDFLDDDYVSSQSMTRDFTGDLEVTLAEDEYFLLGDNRPYSKDSRSYGAFSKEDIISKGLFVLFPFNEFGVK